MIDFRHRRRRQPDQHGRRDQPVGHQLAELEPGRGRRERADAERIEEIDDRAKNDRLERSEPRAARWRRGASR